MSSRQHGVVDTARGLIPFGHLGWGYRDRSEFLARAAEYIADGLAQQQWVEYVGTGDRDRLRAELAGLPGLADVEDVKVTPALEFYGVRAGTDVVDPEAAVALRSSAVHRALREGYTGFRAVVDATSVCERPEQRDAFARFEFLIDQKMAVLPVSALCAYDTSRLGPDAAGLICLHPLVGAAAPSFQLYAEAGADFALTGESDSACAEDFTGILRRIWPLTEGEQVIVDARDLDYIGHQQLVDLDLQARADGRRFVLRKPQPIVKRLAELLDLSNVVVLEN